MAIWCSWCPNILSDSETKHLVPLWSFKIEFLGSYIFHPIGMLELLCLKLGISQIVHSYFWYLCHKKELTSVVHGDWSQLSLWLANYKTIRNNLKSLSHLTETRKGWTTRFFNNLHCDVNSLIYTCILAWTSLPVPILQPHMKKILNTIEEKSS